MYFGIKSVMILFLFCLSIALQSQVKDNLVFKKEFDSTCALVKTYLSKKDFSNANKLLIENESAVILKLGDLSDSYGELCYLRGKSEMSLNNYKSAQVYFFKALPIVRNGKDSLSFQAVQCLSLLGQVLLFDGQINKAEPYIVEALNVCKKTFGDSNIEYGKSLNNLATFYAKTQNFSNAEKYYNESLNFREKIEGKNSLGYAVTLRNLGELYSETDKFDQALNALLVSKMTFESLNASNKIEYILTLAVLAKVYERSGQYDKDEYYLLEAYAIYQKNEALKKNRMYGNTLNQIGVYYYKIGSFEKSLFYYNEAINFYKNNFGQESIEYMGVLNNIARIHSDLGRYDLAEEQFAVVLNFYDKLLGTENIYSLEALQNLILVKLRQGKIDIQDSVFLNIIEANIKIKGKDHHEIAQYLRLYSEFKLLNGHHKQAIHLDTQALNLVTKSFGLGNPTSKSILINLAKSYYEIDSFERAAYYYSSASSIYKREIVNALSYMSDREAYEFTNNLRKDDFNFMDAFGKYQTLDYLIGEAFDDALFYKGNLLNARIQKNRIISRDSSASSLNDVYKSFKRLLAAEYSKPLAERRDLASLENKANVSEKELSKHLNLKNDASIDVHWSQLLRNLKQNEVIIEFIAYPLYNDGKISNTICYAALLIRPDDKFPVFIPLCSEEKLEAQFVVNSKRRMEYVSKLYQKPDNLSRQHDKYLYNLIWKPIESLIKPYSTVYYSPIGLMHRINLNAITLPDNSSVMDQYKLVLLTSTRELLSQSDEYVSNTNESILFGGLQYDLNVNSTSISDTKVYQFDLSTRGDFSFFQNDSSLRVGKWKYLEGTINEVQKISTVFEMNNLKSNIISELNATEDFFKSLGRSTTRASSPRLIHLATHGFFFPDPKNINQFSIVNNPKQIVFQNATDPMIRSGLIMAGANYAWQNGKPAYPNTDDGILTAYEISLMDLSNTELVVLSACETGLGDIAGNEGVYGLQRAFKIAGVKNIMMSLWQVPDKQTSELMQLFYRNWIKDKLPICDALLEAQNSLRKKGLEPYYWAGFVLVN